MHVYLQYLIVSNYKSRCQTKCVVMSIDLRSSLHLSPITAVCDFLHILSTSSSPAVSLGKVASSARIAKWLRKYGPAQKV